MYKAAKLRPIPKTRLRTRVLLVLLIAAKADKNGRDEARTQAVIKANHKFMRRTFQESIPSSSPFKAVLRALQTGAQKLEAGILPPRCAGCNWFEEQLFCQRCRTNLHQVKPPFCACCGEPFDPQAQVLATSLCADCRPNRYQHAPPLDTARSLWVMEGTARRVVYRFKYQNRHHLSELLAHEMALYLSAHAEETPQLIVPVPLHSWRQWRRGYNQSALLARALATTLQTPYAELLRRTRHTPSQTRLNIGQRRENVRDAFAVDAKVCGKYLPQTISHVLLIDDVYTTGATLRECARQLKSAGFASVHALTLTRQPTATNPKIPPA